MSLFSKKGLVTNRLFRKEIRIIRIILSEIICFFKTTPIFGVILGCVAQASKDGNLLIILISFLYKIIPSFFNDYLIW